MELKNKCLQNFAGQTIYDFYERPEKLKKGGERLF